MMNKTEINTQTKTRYEKNLNTLIYEFDTKVRLLKNKISQYEISEKEKFAEQFEKLKNHFDLQYERVKNEKS